MNDMKIEQKHNQVNNNVQKSYKLFTILCRGSSNSDFEDNKIFISYHLKKSELSFLIILATSIIGGSS